MALHVYWEDPEKTIIRCDSTGRWTWDEYHGAVVEIIAMMGSVTHRVYLINTTDDSPMPGGSPQPHFQRAARMFLPNLGINLLVTRSRVARAVLNLWRKIPGNNLPEKVRL